MGREGSKGERSIGQEEIERMKKGKRNREKEGKRERERDSKNVQKCV